jgi:hypothetical protein
MNYRINLALLSLSAISTLAILSIFSSNIYAQQSNLTDNVSSETPKFFAIQHALSGFISKSNATSYTLELNNVSDKIILFSDRPDRIVKSISTQDFINNWKIRSNNHQSALPNVELVLDLESNRDTYVVELLNPIYQKQSKTLKYDILIDDSKTDLQNQFEEVTLVIDAISLDPEGISIANDKDNITNIL